MSKLRKQVGEFHNANDQPILEKPQVPADDRIRLRLALIAEEFLELLVAALENDPRDPFVIAEMMTEFREAVADATIKVDLPKLADALADLDYVVEGTRLEFGIDGGPIANAVHAANMAKMGPDGKPLKDSNGKVRKPEGWQPPDIAGELRKQGWEG